MSGYQVRRVCMYLYVVAVSEYTNTNKATVAFYGIYGYNYCFADAVSTGDAVAVQLPQLPGGHRKPTVYEAPFRRLNKSRRGFATPPPHCP